MSHVDDLHEPNDREPDEPEQNSPVDLDDLEKLYDLAAAPDALPAWRSAVYLRVPELIAELREARRRIAGWEALPTREEWFVTQSQDSTPDDGVGAFCEDKADQAAWIARIKGAQAWRRKLSVHPWEPISPEAPF